MEFRVGINMGDGVIEGDNLYGEGVNVAARLEALAQPRGVCLSKNVHEIVNNKTNNNFNCNHNKDKLEKSIIKISNIPKSQESIIAGYMI